MALWSEGSNVQGVRGLVNSTENPLEGEGGCRQRSEATVRYLGGYAVKSACENHHRRGSRRTVGAKRKGKPLEPNCNRMQPHTVLPREGSYLGQFHIGCTVKGALGSTQTACISEKGGGGEW